MLATAHTADLSNTSDALSAGHVVLLVVADKQIGNKEVAHPNSHIGDIMWLSWRHKESTLHPRAPWYLLRNARHGRNCRNYARRADAQFFSAYYIGTWKCSASMFCAMHSVLPGAITTLKASVLVAKVKASTHNVEVTTRRCIFILIISNTSCQSSRCTLCIQPSVLELLFYC